MEKKYQTHALVGLFITIMDEQLWWNTLAQIQKTFYCYGELCHPFEEQSVTYRLYRNGVHSFELESIMSEMALYYGLKREDSRYGSRYRPNLGIALLLERYGSELMPQIPAIQSLLQTLAPLSLRELESLALYIYALRHAGGVESRNDFNPEMYVQHLKPWLGDIEIEKMQHTYEVLVSKSNAHAKKQE